MPGKLETNEGELVFEDFKAFIKSGPLVQKNDRVLLTVSGGIDSVVMACLFAEAGLEFGIAHCNFKLRGGESDRDAQFVKRLAKKLGTEFYTSSFNTQDYAKKNKISIQMAARDLRYAWFETIRGENKYTKIATAHHKDDQFETVLFNLVKGTGIHGLIGIRKRNNKIIRPLLFASKKDLLEYALSKKITWREDKSNQSLKYHRNLIRNKVIPLLEKINPSLNHSFEETLEKLKVVSTLYDEHINAIKKTVVKKDHQDLLLAKDQILKFKENAPVILFELIKEFGFNLVQAKNILKSHTVSGRKFYSNKRELLIDRNHFIVIKVQPVKKKSIEVRVNDMEVYISSGKISFEKIRRPKVLKTEKNMAFVDYDKLEFPLIIRNWRPGDKFRPLGMKGKKKLSDFMIDRKIPVNLKRRALVLESEGKIVWLIGLGLDDRFKIGPESDKIVKITFTEND